MTITIEMLLDAIRAGYPVEVIINGERYDIKTDADKKEGAENETCQI